MPERRTSTKSEELVPPHGAARGGKHDVELSPGSSRLGDGITVVDQARPAPAQDIDQRLPRACGAAGGSRQTFSL